MLEDGYIDGRFFRDCLNNYDVLMKRYRLKESDFILKDKSEEFKEQSSMLECPDFMFSDYNDAIREYRLEQKENIK